MAATASKCTGKGTSEVVHACEKPSQHQNYDSSSSPLESSKAETVFMQIFCADDLREVSIFLRAALRLFQRRHQRWQLRYCMSRLRLRVCRKSNLTRERVYSRQNTGLVNQGEDLYPLQAAVRQAVAPEDDSPLPSKYSTRAAELIPVIT